MSTPQPPGGLIAAGILNMILGSAGALFCLFVVIGGTLLAVGHAEPAHRADDAAAFDATAAAAIVAAGLLGATTFGLLLAGGIGLLRLARWGRRLSLVAAVALVALMTVRLVAPGGINAMSVGLLAYGGALAAMLLTPRWRASFAIPPETAGAIGTDDDVRVAA